MRVVKMFKEMILEVFFVCACFIVGTIDVT